MSTDCVPQNNHEREAVIHAVVSYLESSSVNPTFIAIESAVFSSARTDYISARDRYDAALAATRTHSGKVEVLAGEFERDLRLFSASVRDEAGRSAPRVLSDLLGGMTPSELMDRTNREKVQRTNGLLRRLGERAGMSWDATRADTLRLSTAALELAVGDQDGAARELRVAGAALTMSKDAFDRAYRALMRAAKAMLDEETVVGVFPTFVRGGADEEDTVELPAAEPAPASPSVEP